jgi:AAA family ATP:ADP antiporter
MFGDRIVGTLGDVLLDDSTPLAVRKQIPRVLRSIPSQRSVDVLIGTLGEPNLMVRSAVVKSLSSLRERSPKLQYGREPVMHQIMNEARSYYEMSMALSPLRENHETAAARLLVETLEGRLRLSLDRLFRLLGLRYPPREIYAAYLAVNRREDRDQHTAAVEFLDNVLDRELKRVVLPLLDEDTRLTQVGQDVFGLQVPDAKSALRELIRSGDSWLVSCAIATAAELHMNDLRREIESVSTRAGDEVTLVAQSALAVLG